MANEYISPTGYRDPSGCWVNEYKAYDGDTDTPSSSEVPLKSWSGYLELTITAMYCSKLRFLAAYSGTSGINSIDLDVYYDGGWHDIYEGSFLNRVWVEKALGSTRYVTKMRMRFYNNAPGGYNVAAVGEAQFYQVVGVPIVSTNAATLVEDDEATLNGNITNTGGEAPTVRGFEYKEGIDGTVQYAYDSGYFSTGAFSKALTGLDPTKQYYFRAYATNSAGTGYGDWRSFGLDVSAPTVTTSAATLIGSDYATLNGNITATGGQDCEERGFQYKIGEDGDVTDLPETGEFGVGAYTGALTDLENFTEYYFRAYAKNGAGTGYGSWLNFTTLLANPTVKTHSATDILSTQAKLNGEIVKTGAGIYWCFTRGFEYGLTKTAENIIEDNGGGEYYAGFFDKTPTGLLPNTKYWYRAYASFDTGIG